MRNRGLSNFFDAIGEILAFVTIATYAIIIANTNWPFLQPGLFLNILQVISQYGAIALIIIVGLEATVKRNFLIKLVFLVFVAIVVVFQFFPGTWEALFNAMPII